MLTLSDRADLVSPAPLCTTAEAEVLGIRLSDARWRRLRKGVYVDRDAYDALPSWKRYATRVHAYLRDHPDAILCLESAAVVHGLPSFGETRFIHVYDPQAARSQRYGDVRIHTSSDGRDIERVGGILVTGLRDTVVDLARVANPAEALAMADAALSSAQGGGLSLSDLRERGEAVSARRGRVRMRWVWENADARAESPAESVSRAVILWSGYEEPELQRVFRYEGHEDRCDFYFPSCRGIGESDGWGKYGLDKPTEAATRLAEEKRREDRLRRHRHPFARWEAGDAWRHERISQALEAIGVPKVRPPQVQMLATLRSRPRALPHVRRTTASVRPS